MSRAAAIARRGVTFGLAAGALAGCSALGATSDFLFGGDRPSRARATVKASGDVNPDNNGRASPLILRLYHLKSSAGFMNADFFAIYDADLGALGPDLLTKVEMQILPGETREIPQFDLGAEVKALGVFAAYRELGLARWRQAVEVKPLNEDYVVKVEAGRVAVALSAVPE